MTEPLEVYIAASRSAEDEPLRAELEAHLEPLASEGRIRVSSGARADVGEHDARRDELERARVVLLLASPDFAASPSCIERDTTRAVARQARGEARVIPILLRAHNWIGTPLADLPAMPLDGEPVASRADRSGAWLEIARSLRAIHARGYLGLPATPAASKAIHAMPPSPGGFLEKVMRDAASVPPSVERGRPQRERSIAPAPIADVPFLVPLPRNARFTGQDAALEAIHARLNTPAEHRATSVALAGPEGIGKTQVALEYAYRYRAEYPGGVYWIDGASGVFAGAAWVTRELYALLGGAPRGGPLSGPHDVNSLGDFLRQRPSLLLVFDHVASPRDRDRVPFFPPDDPHVRILQIVAGAATRGAPLEIPALTEDAALSLLLADRRAPSPPDRDPTDEARAIAQMLGLFPLPITLAAAYLRERPDATLRAYRESLAQAAAARAESPTESAGKAATTLAEALTSAVEAALRVQIDALPGEDARRALLAAALLTPGEAIPRARLALLTDLAEASPSGAKGPLAEALAALEKLALVEAPSPTSVRMHPVVQQLARALLPDLATFAGACAGNLASALRDMDRLGDVVSERGVEAVLADLRAGMSLPATPAAGALHALLRALETAAPALQGWNREQQPDRLLSELCNRAIELGIDDVRALCEAKLLATGRSFLRAVSRPLYPSRSTLQAPAGRVRALAVTASGRGAVTASDSGALHVWDLEAGKLLHTLEGHTAAVNDVAVTALHRLAVSASEDGTTRVWILETGRLARALKGHASGVTCVAVTPDARLAAAGARDGAVLLWDLESGALLRSFRLPSASASSGAAGGVVDVALTPDGRLLIAALGDTIARAWDVESSDLAYALAHEGRVERVEVTANGSAIITVAEGRAPALWDTETGLHIRELRPEQEAGGAGSGIDVIVLTPAAEYVVAARRDTSLELWSTRAGRVVRAFEGHSSAIVGLAVAPYGQRAVSASADGAVRVWEVEAKGELDHGYQRQRQHRRRERRSASVAGLAVTADGRMAASTSSDEGALKLWDTSRGRLTRVLVGHGGTLGPLAMTPDGRVAVTSAQDGSLKVWDLVRGQIVRALKGHHQWVRSVAVTGDGRFILSVGADASGRRWDLKLWDREGSDDARALEVGLPDSPTVAVTPDGRSAVSLGIEALQIWDLESAQRTRAIGGFRMGVTSVSVTADGRRAVFGSPVSPIFVDLETATIDPPSPVPRGGFGPMAVTADGGFATATARVPPRYEPGSSIVNPMSGVEVWDLRAGKMITALPIRSHVSLCAISADGRSIVAGDHEGALHFATWVRPGASP